jgi:hypothetical protein
MPRVELLYFDACPNHEPLSARVRELLAERGLPDAIEPVWIDSHEEALARRFLGSPTLRVDGVDVEPGAGERADYGLNCRLYRGPAGLAGVPDEAWIIAALDDAAARTLERVDLDASRAARAAKLPTAERRLFRRIMAAFAAGGPPSTADLETWTHDLSVDPDTALEALRAADLVQLDAASAITVAYPFSATPTNHRVALDSGIEVWAMCAIDALGIPFMLDRAGVVRAVEPGGEATIEVRVDPARDAVAARPPNAVMVAASTGAGCSADCRCPHINLFTSAGRAAEYLAGHGELTGEIVPVEQAAAVGRLNFSALLKNPPGEA